MVEAATVTGSLRDVGASALAPRLTFTPLDTPLASSTNTVLDVAKTVSPSTNGLFSVSLEGGRYNVGFGPFSKTVRILVPPNDTNTYTFNTVAAWATNLGTFTWTNTFQTAVAPGTNVVFITNSAGVVTISATATGGSTSAAWTEDGDGNLMPSVSGTDSAWEEDGDGNLTPTT